MRRTRTLTLNGYIDDETFFGDEITPEILNTLLCGEDGTLADDVAIALNSYGGSCNAATRMYDLIRAYPGSVTITISGTAASAATIVASAADVLEMTPGSLYMIHDPSVLAWGNEREFTEVINLLRASKSALLNIYALRSPLPRDETARMMAETTWMDAQTALEKGFIDRITHDQTPSGAVANASVPCAPIVSKAEAEQKVRAWLERKRPAGANFFASNLTDFAVKEAPKTPASQLYKRLALLK